MRRLVAAGAWSIVVAIAPLARAQSATSNEAAAQVLFDEARRMMADGKYAEACPKLVESERLDPGPGTLLNLGDCYEKNGQTASAWATFREALAMSERAQQPERVKIAKDRSAALEPRLPRLVLRVERADTPGLEVATDGHAFGKALWGTALPLDPGSHTVDATAPGKLPWHATVDVAEGERRELVVPALGDAPAAAPAPHDAVAAPRSNAAPPPSSSQRTVGAVVSAAGLVVAVAGGIVGGIALSRWSSAKDADARGDGAEANRASKTAVTLANVSTIALGLGVVAIAGGAILFFTAPAPDGARVAVTARW